MAAKFTRPEPARNLRLWGYLQSQVGEGKPKCLDALTVATRQAADEMPLEMVERALYSFTRRAAMCVQKEGGWNFQGRKVG